MTRAGEPSTAVIGAVAFPKACVRAAEMHRQRAASLLVLPDVSRDRLVTDRQNLEPCTPADHLRRAVVLAEHRLDQRPFRRTELRIPARTPPPLVGVRLGARGHVSASIAAPHVATQLAADGTRVATECTGHLGWTVPVLAQQAQRIPFVSGDLGVRHQGFLSLGGGLKPSVPQVAALVVRRVALTM